MHAPPQLVFGAGQVVPHLPAAQTSPLLHAVPHAPQFFGSSWVSKQALSHWVSPPGQTTAHPLSVHTSPATHLVPQVPQLFGSILVLVHDAPHAVSGAAQELPHVPPPQTSPLLHVFPQSPQFFGSNWTLVHVPLQTFWSPLQVPPPPPSGAGPVSTPPTPVSAVPPGSEVLVLLPQPPPVAASATRTTAVAKTVEVRKIEAAGSASSGRRRARLNMDDFPWGDPRGCAGIGDWARTETTKTDRGRGAPRLVAHRRPARPCIQEPRADG